MWQTATSGISITASRRWTKRSKKKSNHNNSKVSIAFFRGTRHLGTLQLQVFEEEEKFIHLVVLLLLLHLVKARSIMSYDERAPGPTITAATASKKAPMSYVERGPPGASLRTRGPKVGANNTTMSSQSQVLPEAPEPSHIAPGVPSHAEQHLYPQEHHFNVPSCSSTASLWGDPPAVLSTSSALPSTMPATSIPTLSAKVHSKLVPERLDHLTSDDLVFRPLRTEDLEQLKLLHKEWFPLNYDDAFFDSSVKGNVYSLAACIPDDLDCMLGLITVSTHCHHHSSDISRVLNGSCDTLCRDGTPVAYILTLGVVDEFRRRGLARKLIQETIQDLTKNNPSVHVLTLHVVTYNEAAIELYKSLGFIEATRYVEYYDLGDKQVYDSLLFAKYLKGEKPPLAIRIRLASSHFVGWSRNQARALFQWISLVFSHSDSPVAHAPEDVSGGSV